MKPDHLDQHVVIYDAKEETGVVYATAYTETDIQRTLHNCRLRHGTRCNARTMLAKKRMAGQKR